MYFMGLTLKQPIVMELGIYIMDGNVSSLDHPAYINSRFSLLIHPKLEAYGYKTKWVSLKCE